MNKLLASKYGWLYLLLILLGVNYMASLWHVRLDLTQEKRYTLSDATKKLLKGLPEEVSVEVFF